MRFSKRQLSVFLLPLLAACAASTDGATSSAPTEGPVASVKSAINPEQSSAPVQYTVSLASVDVLGTDDIEGGTYVDYATLGISEGPFNGAGTLQYGAVGCSLGNATTGAVLSKCVSGSTNGGSTLTQTVTVYNESDTVTIGVALNNIETTPVQTLNLGTIGQTLSMEGSTLSTVGSFATTVGAGEFGAVLSAVGSIESYASSLFPSVGNETPCTGGLIAAPAGGYPGSPHDTIYTRFSGAQLEAMTNFNGTGSASYSLPVSVQWPSTLPNDLGGMCDSQHVINMTVSRVQGTGPAADPISGGSGVARTGVEFDAIVADAQHQGMALVSQTNGGGWSTQEVTSSVFATGAYTPTATLSLQRAPLQEGPWGPWSQVSGALSLVAPTATTPGSTNLESTLESFWFDSVGTLWHTNYTPSATVQWTTYKVAAAAGVANSRLTATSRNPNTMDVFWINASGVLMDQTIMGTATGPTAATTTAAPGAAVASVSRTNNTMDAFYVDKNGQLFDVSFTAGIGWSKPLAISALGFAPSGAYLSAVARDANSIDVFVVGNINGDVYDAKYAAQAVNGQTFGWSAPQALPGATSQPGAPISAVSRTEATISLAYENNYKIDFMEYNPAGTANWTTPTLITGPSLVSQTTDLSLVARDNADLGLFFRDWFNNQWASTWNQATQVWSSNKSVLPSWKWQGWDSVSGGLVTDPALVSPNSSNLVTAATGPDGTIWYSIYSYAALGWSGWKSLGNKGNAITDPPVMAVAGNKLEVFVRDPVTKSMLHQEGTCESTTTCNAPVFNASGWEVLNYLNATPIAPGKPTVIVSQPNNQINLFATGTDGSAHLLTGTGYGAMGSVYSWTTGWSLGQWTSLSGGVLYQPAAVSWGPNRLDAFVVGGNYQLYHRYSNDNGVTWYPANGNWEDVGGSVKGSPTAVSWGANRLDVFVNGTSTIVQHLAWNGSAWGWDTIAGMMGSSTIAAFAHGTGMIDVFSSGSNTDSLEGLFTTSMISSGSPATWAAPVQMAGCNNGGAPSVASRDGVNIDLVMTAYAANHDASVWHNSTSSSTPTQDTYGPASCGQSE